MTKARIQPLWTILFTSFFLAFLSIIPETVNKMEASRNEEQR